MLQSPFFTPKGRGDHRAKFSRFSPPRFRIVIGSPELAQPHPALDRRELPEVVKLPRPSFRKAWL